MTSDATETTGSTAESQSFTYGVSAADVVDAEMRIAPHAPVTPVYTCSTLNKLAGCSMFFKAEVFQRTGSFKFRGAANAVFSLTDEQAAKGVVTHSSGNHAQALALAAKLRGIPSYIVVPQNTPATKLDAIMDYNGRITQCAPTIAAREAAAAKVQKLTGATFIPPYNDVRIIAGQGTVALELMQQVPELDIIVVPISGGGLISGAAACWPHNTHSIALAAKAVRPETLIVGAEPVGNNESADVAQSLIEGRCISDLPAPDTIADGLRGKMGDLTWPIIRDHVDGVVTVTEREIVDAMTLIFERMKVVVEPSGAVALAAVLSSQFRGRYIDGEPGAADSDAKEQLRVGVLLCGGNVDMRSFFATLAGGEAAKKKAAAAAPAPAAAAAAAAPPAAEEPKQAV